MSKYDLINEVLKNSTSLETAIRYPLILDIHPVLNSCNLKCSWCIGGKSNETNTINKYYANFDDYSYFLESIFDESRKKDWPREVHICGNNSEPLLNEKFVKKLALLLKDKCKIKIITNGVLLHKYMDIIQYIDKINISVDVLSPEEFIKKKGGNHQMYMKIQDNICKINQYRRSNNLQKPILYSSFVIDEDYDVNVFESVFQKLKSMGINHIQIRKNYFFEDVDNNLENKISVLKNKLLGENTDYIDYNHDSIDTFDIKYNKKSERRENNQKCYSFYLWPAIAANHMIYPCAHTANESYDNYGVKISKDTSYYSLFQKIYYEKRCFNCKDSSLCPSNLNYLNTKLLEYFRHVKLNSIRTVFENDWIRLSLMDIVLNGHKIKEYTSIEHKKDSVVVLVRKNNEILLTENYRFLINCLSIELPAGNIEEYETIIDAAKREVYEETGIEINNARLLGSFYPSNGVSNQEIFVVETDYFKGNIKIQDSELDRAYWCPIQSVKQLIYNNEIKDGPSLIALSLLKERQ